MSVASAINILRTLTLEAGRAKPADLLINETLLDFLLMEVIDATTVISKEKYHKDHKYFVEAQYKLKDSEPAPEEPKELEHIDYDSENISKLIHSKLDAIGFRIGTRVAERYSVDVACFTDTLSAIKYLCRDIWCILFDKQIDNLKTNHKGVFIIQDYRFRWVTKFKNNKEKASQYLAIASGIIRGILDSYGIKATILYDFELPHCTFNITVLSSIF